MVELFHLSIAGKDYTVQTDTSGQFIGTGIDASKALITMGRFCTMSDLLRTIRDAVQFETQPAFGLNR